MDSQSRCKPTLTSDVQSDAIPFSLEELTNGIKNGKSITPDMDQNFDKVVDDIAVQIKNIMRTSMDAFFDENITKLSRKVVELEGECSKMRTACQVAEKEKAEWKDRCKEWEKNYKELETKLKDRDSSTPLEQVKQKERNVAQQPSSPHERKANQMKDTASHPLPQRNARCHSQEYPFSSNGFSLTSPPKRSISEPDIANASRLPGNPTGNVDSTQRIGKMDVLDAVERNRMMTNYLAEVLDAKNWMPVLRILGVPNSKLTDIKHDYASNVKEQRYQALLFWFDKNGLKAKPDQIVDALVKNSLRATAEGFCDKFQLPKPEPAVSNARPPSLAMPARNGAVAGASPLSLYFTNSSGMNTIPFSPSAWVENHFIKVVRLYINTGEANDFLCDIQRASFSLKSQDDFIKMLTEQEDNRSLKDVLKEISSTECNNWKDVFEWWAKALMQCKLDTAKPFIHLWNVWQTLIKSNNSELQVIFRKHLVLGSLGPHRNHREKIGDSKWSFTNSIEMKLAVKKEGDWRKLAEDLGFSNCITLWEQNQVGSKNCLELLKTRCWTLGNLYDWACKNGRTDIIDFMETPK